MHFFALFPQKNVYTLYINDLWILTAADYA